jgi:outer membrane protein assembly factor BamA
MPSLAQLPKRLERCLPNPTLAQEIRDMRREVEPEPQKVNLHVTRVEFDPKSGIPLEIQREISADVRRENMEEDADSDYLKEVANEIAEVAVRIAAQNRGYFRVLPHAKLTLLKREGSDIQVAAAVSAELGPQYWVGEIEFVPADPNRPLSQSQKVLRDLISLKPGDLLNVDALREGLRILTHLYTKEGFIDMTAEPEFNTEDAEPRHVVNLIFRIDEQMQYRMGEIEIWGLDAPAKQQLLKSLPLPGEIFDGYKVQQSFEINKKILPADASPYEDVNIQRDPKAGTVSMLFDFRPCPGEAN